MKISVHCLFVVLFYVALNSQVHAGAPVIQSDSDQSTEGYFRLSWQSSEAGIFLLQESSDPEFTNVSTLYDGPDTASLVSGRSDGVYYYRVRLHEQTDKKNFWSNVAKVEVVHHSLFRAFMFFSLGAIVFIATLVVVVTGSKANKH